ncbi:MAG: AbrB/MazE/SpoVT family DNA-binding domain-containing protein [Verrucomicrobiales bacterium]|nr:AbrB/MazE/SpoVT family DNA-binding domain-containing protein [Verrucomicrobiales bacterium]
MKVTSKGQVTIPRHIRKFLGISPHSEVEFQITEDRVELVARDSSAGNETKNRIHALRGLKKGGPSSDEWLEATRGD